MSFVARAAATAIGIDWLETALAPAGEFGRKRSLHWKPFVRGDEARASSEIELVARVAEEFASERVDAIRVALANAPDPATTAARALSGDVLDDVDFFELTRFLDALTEIRSLAGDREIAGLELPDTLDALRAALAPGRKNGRTFYLDGAFDAALAALRDEAAARQAFYDLAHSRLRERVERALGAPVRDGEFVVMRDALHGRLPAELRVVREAATYYSCELALDDATLRALAELEEAQARVAEAEECVRTRLSEAVRAAAGGLARASEHLGALDLLAARARFAQRHACIVPEVGADSAFEFEDARFLPLEEALAARGRAYTPISLRLEGVAVVTGPNMGGKTAALRTCGFIAACVAYGVPVPARAARVPLFDDIAWIGIAGETLEAGDSGVRESGASESSERRLLSSFGAEVIALREFFESSAQAPLVLIDEFARTTTPREGRALLVALLERLRERGAHAFAATHLHGIACESGAAHFAIAGLRELPALDGATTDLSAALERIARAMDYRLVEGGETESSQADAFALAEALGLDRDLLNRARAELAGA